MASSGTVARPLTIGAGAMDSHSWASVRPSAFSPPNILDMHVRHLAALRQRQLPSGLFGQVLNVPGSYQEFTVTCMIGYAMARAVRRGWLEASYRPTIDLAWQGVAERIDDAG